MDLNRIAPTRLVHAALVFSLILGLIACSPEPTPTPQPTPTPTISPMTLAAFVDGYYEVGPDLSPGAYIAVRDPSRDPDRTQSLGRMTVDEIVSELSGATIPPCIWIRLNIFSPEVGRTPMRAYGSFIQNDMIIQLEQVNLFRDEAIVEIDESDEAFYSSNCDLWLPIEEYRLREGDIRETAPKYRATVEALWEARDQQQTESDEDS